jgi:ADP-glucose pyrophosphorylase
VKLILDEPGRGLPLVLSNRWKRHALEVLVLEDGIRSLLDLLGREDADLVIMSSLSAVAVLDPGSLIDFAPVRRGELVKISIQNTPLETYVARRDVLVKLLSANSARLQKRRRSKEYLFEGVLFSSIDLLQEIPGILLFQNNIMELYQRNIWLASHPAGEEYRRVRARLPELADKPPESRIAERGYMKNSFICPGAEIDGYVEGSVIFPNVSVRANSKIIGSVIMNNNKIGTGTTIQNAIVLPYSGEAPRNSPNIGDNCFIGGRSPSASNEDFPEQIREGLTVLGMNAAIPNGFRAEPAGFVGPQSNASRLRRQKLLKKGMSILEDGHQ